MGQAVVEHAVNQAAVADQLVFVIEPRLLPPDFHFPDRAQTAIEGLLMHTREEMLELRQGQDYQPTDKDRRILNEFDTIFRDRETEELTQEQLEALLAQWAARVSKGESRVMAEQLRDLGAIMGNMISQQQEQARTDFLTIFCPTNGIDPEQPESVFTSRVQNPAIQALALRYLWLSNRGLDFNTLNKWALALRWHFLERTDPHTVRSLTGSLNAFALRAATTGEEEKAIELFAAGIELALQAQDPVWRRMTENRLMVLSGLGRFHEASVTYDDFYAQVAEGLAPLDRAIMDGNRLVTKFADYRQASSEDPRAISVEQWQDLADQITQRVPFLEQHKQMASVLELKIALAYIRRHLGNFAEAQELESSLVDLAKKVYPLIADAKAYVHPGLVDDVEKLYPSQ